MGTINYGSNEYINMGVNPENYWIENENGENEFLDFEMQWGFEQIENALKKYAFEYFTVKLKSGYYEGFYIDIFFNYNYVDAYEKPLILKELTQLKHFLLGCCNYGLVEYYPGWSMGYSDTIHTKKAINDAIKAAKEKIKKYPTYKTYKKGA
jgi:hypothetical protein